MTEQLPALTEDQELIEAAGDLSPMELTFASEVLGGASYVEAFLTANEAAQKWQRRSAYVAATRMAAKPHIQEYLTAARRAGAQLGAQTLEGYVAGVERDRELARGAEQFSAVARLAEISGKATGYLAMASPAGHGDAPSIGPNELVIAARLRFGSEAARKVALAYGLLDLAVPTTIDGEATTIEGNTPRCELSLGCPSGPGRGSWSCEASAMPRGTG